MFNTPHLALPLLAAAQAQKHVTHNEALSALDALVHLSVKERGRSAAPSAPAEGERYLVGRDAVGSFANHEGEIALFDVGAWRFFQPRKGWRAFVEAEDSIVVFDGSEWRDLGHYSRNLALVERLGLGATPDSLNRIAAKLNAALFSALASEEGGTGDLRFTLNKSAADRVLSQLYQRGFSGRAETGLIGSDHYSIRVSANGEEWRDALFIDCNTGIASFPSGATNVPRENLLLNSSFCVNQRKFIGGTLAEGVYGFDRWKGGAGGCTLSLFPDGTVSLTGSLVQVIEQAQAKALLGLGTFAGATLTVSLQSPSVPVAVAVGASAASIPAGSGRQSATLSLGSTETGNIALRLQTASPCALRGIKLELGSFATPWVGAPPEIE